VGGPPTGGGEGIEDGVGACGFFVLDGEPLLGSGLFQRERLPADKELFKIGEFPGFANQGGEQSVVNY
jgi:hypothetical protein